MESPSYKKKKKCVLCFFIIKISFYTSHLIKLFSLFTERNKAWDTIAKKTVSKTPAPFGLDISAMRPKSPTKSSSSANKQQSKIDTFLKFSFQMDSIILNLFTGKHIENIFLGF